MPRGLSRGAQHTVSIDGGRRTRIDASDAGLRREKQSPIGLNVICF